MKIVDYISSAQTNLLRTKVRTFLTISAFVIGTFTLAMVTAFSQGLRSYVNTQLGAYGQPNSIIVTLGSKSTQTGPNGIPYYQPNRQSTVSSGGGPRGNNKSASYTLNQSDLSKIKSVSGVIGAYPDYTSLTIDYVQYGNLAKYVMGVQGAYPSESISLAAGNFPTSTQTDGIVIPYSYIQAFGGNDASGVIGKTLNIQVSSSANNTKLYQAVITGVLPNTAHQPSAYLANQLITSMVQFQSGTTSQFTSIVALANSNVTKSQRLAIKSSIQSLGYQAMTYDDLIANFNQPLTVVSAGLTGFAAIALLAATIGIVNTLLMAVLERTQEIGLLKALGMRRKGITFIYLVEAASIGFWGGVIGVILATLVGFIANPILNKTVFTGIGSAHLLTYPLSYMAGIILGAMVVGLLAGTLPAIRAGKLDPIEALRHE